jgi:alpha-tubulin suppressor-like RCC1 family protein
MKKIGFLITILIILMHVVPQWAQSNKIWAFGECLPWELSSGGYTNVPIMGPDWMADDWIQIEAGCFSTVFLRSDKKLFQLCLIDNQQNLCPLMDNINTVASGGGAYWLVLKTDGTVWGWGSNVFGELGDGTNIGREEPVQAIGLENIVSIAVGESSYALRSDGTVWAWGPGANGGLGDGNSGCTVFPPVDPADCYLSTVPKQVPNLTDVKALFDGPYIVKNDGTVWAWGLVDCLDQCCFAVPQQIEGLEDIISVSDHTALKADGTVWTWGDNHYGQLGNGTIDKKGDTCYPAGMVPALSNVTAVGPQFAKKADGTLWGWGPHYGLGVFPYSDKSLVPTQVHPLIDVRLMSLRLGSGYEYSIALAGAYEPVVITKATVLHNPFRLKIKGKGFLSGLEMNPYTPPILYMNGFPLEGLEIRLRKEGILIVRDNPASLLKCNLPKGTTKIIQIKNPDGRMSNEFEFTR